MKNDRTEDGTKKENEGGCDQQQSRLLRRRFDFFLSRGESVKWIWRGVLSIPVLMIVDHFFRQYRGTGSTAENVFRILMIISVIGVLQFVFGLYGVIRHWIKGEEQKSPQDTDE
jgi:hypothetical protein